MSHVDEGALHAYLDGALDEYPAAEARRVREHLEACAECRTRLEAERAIRDEAATILGLAAPEVEVPTFEELRRYVQQSRPAAPRGAVRLYRLGWAASVILALGTGWVLRGGEVPTATFRDAASPVLAPSEAESGASFEFDEVAASTGGVERQLEAEAPSAGSESTAEQVDANAPSTPPAAAPSVATAAAELRENVGFADAVTRDDVAGRAQAASAALSADADAFGLAAPPPEPALDQLAAGADVAAPPAELSPLAEQVSDAAAEPEPLRNEEVAQVQPRTTDAVGALARRATEPAAVVTSGIAADAGRVYGQRLRVAPDEEFEAEEPLPLSIPGLETLAVVQLREGTTFAGSRALQLLESGDTLEVIYLPEGWSPESLPPASDRESELQLQRGAEWLVMRAPVPLAVLQELLQRVEPGR